MMRYDCFILDHYGHIKDTEILTARDDADAIAQGASYLRNNPGTRVIEIWLKGRRVDALTQISLTPQRP